MTTTMANSLLLSVLLLALFTTATTSFGSNAVESLESFAVAKFPLNRRILATNGNTTNSTSGDIAGHHHKKKIWAWILGFLGGVVAGVLSGFISSMLFRLLMDCIQGRFRNPMGPVIFSPLIKKAEDLAFLENDGVAELEVIGRGGCGEVYRAPLPGNSQKLIAIKKIKKHNVSDHTSETGDEESRLLEKGMRQLRSEINTVGHIRHRNLLPLLAHVPRPDCNYLIYEYMKNGSLQDALRKAADGTEDLPWPVRLRIAQGVTAGLEYLHTQLSPRIIHRDLKPANILLDDDLEARIADFGLAKAMPDANTHMTTSNVAGTVGYIAPEYHQMLKFTEKCDIYSLGVILAVLVVGKMPSDDYFQSTDEMSMIMWLRNVMSHGEGSPEIIEVIDANLRGKGFEEDMALVLRVACICTDGDPKKRPTSKEVRYLLSQVKSQQQ